ncbi:MAG TPA: sigma-70 family RNA polymerase sigma factor [Bacteroidales bacterium]|nr:sigma-70 family RNA polymerase sigma factor [Bacteroidales bacterium]
MFCSIRRYVTSRESSGTLTENLEILIKGCRRGDPVSQKTLYEQFSAAMYGLCLQYASSEEDAKDILQDGFVKVFKKISQVKEPKALPGWIKRVMINTALEKYRSQVHIKRVNEDPLNVDAEISDDTLSSLESEAIINLIRELSPQYRMVFSLYAIEGYNHKEIAEKLQISEGTSKSNLSRARIILQEKVLDLYGETKLNEARGK